MSVQTARLVAVLVVTIVASACSATDNGGAGTAITADKRYVVDRSDPAPSLSAIYKIETLRDRQTGNCFMVVATGSGVAVLPTTCENSEHAR